MPDPLPYFFELDPTALRDLVVSRGLPAFRAQQILDWVYRQGVSDPQEMSNLSLADRKIIQASLCFTTAQVVKHQLASDGVQKLLLAWDRITPQTSRDLSERAARVNKRSEQFPQTIRISRDMEPDEASRSLDQLLPITPLHDPANQTECVMIPAGEVEAINKAQHISIRARRTACVSSQIGCPVGCRFCASGLAGLDGNLSSGQIVEQVWRLGTLQNVSRISHVVFMGMGEPLANFENVVRAVQILTADWGLNISARRITISTVGLPAQIRRLAQLELPVTLAISLHAPNDQLRKQIIPWASFVSIHQIIDAARDYFHRTGREITLEYILLGGLNDQPRHARELASLAKQLRSNVNLLRYNQVPGIEYQRPTDDAVRQFQLTLRNAGVNTHIRASRGRDIAAACGQLRHEHSPPIHN